MQKNSDVKFEILQMPPRNTNSLVVYSGRDAVIFDAWGRCVDWERALMQRGLILRAIYSTHGHPDHISAAPDLAEKFNIDWYLNSGDEYLIGWGNELLDMFNIPRINKNCKKPIHLSAGNIEILPGVNMEIIESPGHSPGGLMFYFPQYKILMTGDTIFRDGIGRTDFPGGNADELKQSIHNLYEMDLDDDTYVVHGHGIDSTIKQLKNHNEFFKA